MDPLQPQNTPAEPTPTPPPSAFGTQPELMENPPNSHKKLILIVAGVVTFLIIIGAGISVWAIQNHNNQLAEAAKTLAQQKAKAAAETKAREGTVSDIETTIEDELKQTQDLNDSFTYNANDSLKQEADTAATIGTGNDSGL